MLQKIRKYLIQAVDDIDSGNSNLTEEEALQVAKSLREIVRKDIPMSKYQAYTYLNMSRAQFDNFVRKGKIPRGKKVPGYKELGWFKKDLVKVKKDLSRK